MTAFHDLFVGLVAVLIGCLLLGGAAIDSQMLMSLAKLRLLAESVGRTAARWMIAGVGMVSIALGVLIASGWRLRW